MGTPTVRVVRATKDDLDDIVTILSTGFQGDPVSRWIFPDDGDRERLHPDFFRPFVEMSFEDGEIYTTADRSAAALWLPFDAAGAGHGEQPDLGELYEPLIGPFHAGRVAMFDERSSDNHPTRTDHVYLPFVAVRPGRTGAGIGSALIRDRLGDLDRRGGPTYLEASNQDSARLYERLGYKRIGPTTDLPGGPSLLPIWRDPS
jgi:ribosomal protein S18 acetylase RimI-like enzyme